MATTAGGCQDSDEGAGTANEPPKRDEPRHDGEELHGEKRQWRTASAGTARMKRGVPLYFAYVTAWATEDGTVHFRPDLYQKDGVGEVAAAY